jgi:hypothetical protein
MGKTFVIALVRVPGGAMLGGTPATVRGVIYWGDIYGLQAAIFGTSRLLESLKQYRR